jgi:hypothetical protein
VRAITLRPQWAYAVARLGKDVENRTWPLWRDLEGARIAIHAARDPFKKTELGRMDFYATPLEGSAWKALVPDIDAVRGCIVALATVSTLPPALLAAYGTDHDWVLPGCAYQWALADVQPLAVPVPCRGAQGFWRVPAPVERLIVRIAADGACAPTMHEV